MSAPRAWVEVLSLSSLLALATACGNGAFACLGAEACQDAGVGGVCQPDGWCSFPDDGCPSGQRYGDHAGDGLAGGCVPPGDDGTTGGDSVGSTDVTSVSTSATTTSATSTTTSATSATTTTTTTTTTASTGADAVTDAEVTGPDSDSDTAPPGFCGDGVQDPGEACDLGDGNANDGECLLTCQLAACGDGFVRLDVELCDGMVPDDTCAQHGFGGGDLGCDDDCQGLVFDGCIACLGLQCPPYPACNSDQDCGGDASCVILDFPGTCVFGCNAGPGLDCDGEAEFCAQDLGACVRECSDAVPCPEGMICTPLEDASGCLW